METDKKALLLGEVKKTSEISNANAWKLKIRIMELQPGTFLQDGRYQIVGVIGQGGFGITYKALQPALDRYVAIKEFFMKKLCKREGDTSRVTVPTESAREEAALYRAKFLKEARTIAALNHPNIVRIHDIFEENNTAYYVMEFLDGGSLSAVGVLPQERALGYIRQIGGALQYMHERKTMHLDVKPGNIMLRADGTAVLIDFGISKHYDASDGETSRTPVGISKGYAPAEQYREGGVSTFSPTSDVYSLAATLYKLLTGITPPESIDLQNGEAELAPYPSGVSATCKQAIARALRPRKERPQTVTEFLRLLDTEASGDATQLAEDKKKPLPEGKHSSNKPSGTMRVVLGLAVLVVVALFVYLLGHNKGREGDEITPVEEVVQVENTMSEEAMRYKGVLSFNTGIYEGEILAEKADGWGKMSYNDGDFYEGDWKQGRIEGFGTFISVKEDRYIGGYKYVGYFKNGLRNGRGTLTWGNGYKYEGDWNNDLMDGKGIFTWDAGHKYVGDFKLGNKHGQGTLYNADGSISYSGQWVNDEPVR